ncbi:MAG: glucosaminidase domain-containing protein [Patescibacteria group bacterium]|nr:glucosaminidase domain-containing protein [Patescibacteria group bacterium]
MKSEIEHNLTGSRNPDIEKLIVTGELKNPNRELDALMEKVIREYSKRRRNTYESSFLYWLYFLLTRRRAVAKRNSQPQQFRHPLPDELFDDEISGGRGITGLSRALPDGLFDEENHSHSLPGHRQKSRQSIVLPEINRRRFIKLALVTVGAGIASPHVARAVWDSTQRNQSDQTNKIVVPARGESVEQTDLTSLYTPKWEDIIEDIKRLAASKEFVSGIIRKAPLDQTCVFGPPSENFTIEKIEQILIQYNSPALKEGAKIWIEIPKKYGIKAEFIFAIATAESGIGSNQNWAGLKPDGSTSNNAGNITCSENWEGRCYKGFRDYDTWAESIEDLCILIWFYALGYINGRELTTVEQIIPVYAPASDGNNPTLYIQTVVQLMKQWGS